MEAVAKDFAEGEALRAARPSPLRWVDPEAFDPYGFYESVMGHPYPAREAA
ncbi:hypothetical protein ACWCYY_18435 [Kitasatospora sp. NPDC001664]